MSWFSIIGRANASRCDRESARAASVSDFAVLVRSPRACRPHPRSPCRPLARCRALPRVAFPSPPPPPAPRPHPHSPSPAPILIGSGSGLEWLKTLPVVLLGPQVIALRLLLFLLSRLRRRECAHIVNARLAMLRHACARLTCCMTPKCRSTCGDTGGKREIEGSCSEATLSDADSPRSPRRR